MASGSAGFAQKAAMGGRKEVETARFVSGKTSNQAVKAYADRLVKDHTAANEELMGLMKTKRIAAGTESKAEPQSWRNQSGAAFDRAYIDHAISEHQATIAMFEAESKNGTDPEIKAWAAKKLPTLREHLKAAQDVKAKLTAS
jgi:putative membrane protein